MWSLIELKYWEIPIHFDANKYKYVTKMYCNNGLFVIDVIKPVKDTFKIFHSTIIKIDLSIGKIVSTELWTVDDTNKEYPYISFGAMRYSEETNTKYVSYTRKELLDIRINKLNSEVQRRLGINIENILETDIPVVQKALIKYVIKDKQNAIGD